MQTFPHHYTVSATGSVRTDVELKSGKLPTLPSAPPLEFDGPGDRWSPETLLVAAVADCFVLTFKAIAAASKLSWTSLECGVTGTLDRIDRATQFTAFDLHVRLAVPIETDREQANRIVTKAEHACLITNSLKGAVRLSTEIAMAPDAAEALIA
jgi:organic hydroperoxide reductase OsmC/OhrA